MTLSIKNADTWNSNNTLYAKTTSYGTGLYASKESYVKDNNTWKPFYRTEGPTLRVLGGAFATNSGTVPPTLTITIPATAQVGDYIVVACTNSANPTEPNVGGTAWVTLYGSNICGTYCETATVHIKICTATDIGRTYYLSASGFAIQALVYVFTNPNKIGTLTAYPFYGYNNYDLTTQSNPGNTSSIIVPYAYQLPIKYNYECKLFIFAANGSSTFPTQSYSGPGVFRQLTDSYWWRSIGVSYIENNTGSAYGTCSLANASALSPLQIVLP